MTKFITLLAFLYLFTFTSADRETTTLNNNDLNIDVDDLTLKEEPLLIDVAEPVDIKAIEEASRVEINNGFQPVETGEDLTFNIVEEETLIPLVEETDLQAGAVVVDAGEVIVDYVENGEEVQAVVEEEEAKLDYIENGELIVQVEDDITEGVAVNALLVENEEDGFTEVISNLGWPGDDEEDFRTATNEEDDTIFQNEIPVLVLEEESEITLVMPNPGYPGDDEEEFINRVEEDDVVDEKEIPILPDVQEVTPGFAVDVKGDDEEEESLPQSEESDDVNEGEIPILPDEQEVTAGFAVDVKADDEEEEPIDTDEIDGGEPDEVFVFPEDVPGEDGVTPGIENTKDLSDDSGEEPRDESDERDDEEPDASPVETAKVKEKGFLVGRN